MKRKVVLLLAAVMLMGTLLAGCVDKDEDRPNSSPEDRQRYYQDENPNRPPPQRNPDGSIG